MIAISCKVINRGTRAQTSAARSRSANRKQGLKYACEGLSESFLERPALNRLREDAS